MKSMRVFKNMMKLRLIAGHYHDPGCSKVMKIVLRVYCLLVLSFFVTFYAVIFPNPFNFQMSYSFTMVEVITSMLLSIVLKGKYVNSLYAFIERTHEFLNLGRIHMTNYICFALALAFTVRTYFMLVNGSFVYSDMRSSFMIAAYTTFFVNYVSKVIVFDTIYQVIKSLREQVEFKHMTIKAIGRAKIAAKVENVKKCLYIYHDTLDFIKDVDLEIESWICLLLLTGLPKTVMYTYKAMKTFLCKDYITRTPSYIFFYNGFNTVLLICLPAILFEMISNEVDNIRNILISNSLVCTDEVLLMEIQRTLDYMKFRPMKYSIWRMFALNATLPLKFVSLCVTYIIVSAQFTSLV